MKKMIFLFPVALIAILTTGISVANAKTTNVFKQTATVYQMKKSGNTYKITNQTKKTTDRDLNISKIINVKGQSYYYSKFFKGYINDKDFALNAKLDEKRAKYASKPILNNKKKDTNTDSNSNSTHSSNNIQNGYDNDTDNIVNFSEYQRVYIQTMLSEINKYRTSHGLNALTLDPALTQIAQTRAQQNYEFRNESWFDGHHDQNGNFIAQQLANNNNVPYTTIGENGSYGFSISGADAIMENPVDAAKEQVQESIMEGPQGGHYQNLMNPKFTKVGLGVFTGPNDGQQTKGGVDQVYTD